ncbi:MAG: hypothetical protein FJ096_04880 [Deltaproteobacteria bacterium]|nr:hypothetical protein [Deltaproteobacteria bacterium]
MASEPADPTESDTKTPETADSSKSPSEQPAESPANPPSDAKDSHAEDSHDAAESPAQSGNADAAANAEAPRPMAATAPSAKPASAKPASAKAASAKTAAARPGAKGKRPAPRKAGISMRNVVIFGALVALLLAGFGVLGTRDAGGPDNKPRWKLNEPVDIELTLVANDANDLACSMEGDLAGLHCGYTAANVKNPAAQGSREDAKLLQPYATTNRQNLFAANVWMQPELKDVAALEARIKTLPQQRFALSCKFTPRGFAKSAKVQWKPGSDWGQTDKPWYAGEVKDCKIVK